MEELLYVYRNFPCWSFSREVEYYITKIKNVYGDIKYVAKKMEKKLNEEWRIVEEEGFDKYHEAFAFLKQKGMQSKSERALQLYTIESFMFGTKYEVLLKDESFTVVVKDVDGSEAKFEFASQREAFQFIIKQFEA